MHLHSNVSLIHKAEPDVLSWSCMVRQPTMLAENTTEGESLCAIIFTNACQTHGKFSR